MKNRIIVFFIPLFFSGCGIGGYWMNGNPFVSEPGPPRIETWIKPDTSAEQRVQDSKECGGTPLGSSFNEQQIETEREPGEKGYSAPLARLHHKWERCMLGKGYQYIGQCYLDDSVSRNRPACGAP